MISVILPTYNERENIPEMIANISAQLEGQVFEIIVVDDRSIDGTRQVVQQIGSSKVRLIERHSTVQRSYARSIYDGILLAQGNILLIMDSDFNHNPADIHRLLSAIKNAPCVSASRFLPQGRMVPAWRGWLSRLFNIFVRLMINGRLTDYLFGFYAIRRDIVDQLPLEGIFYGFGDYGIRLLFSLEQKGYHVLEIPAVCFPRRHGQGNQRLCQTFWLYSMAVMRLFWRGGRLR